MKLERSDERQVFETQIRIPKMGIYSAEESFDYKYLAFSCEASIWRLQPNLWEDRWEQSGSDTDLLELAHKGEAIGLEHLCPQDSK